MPTNTYVSTIDDLLTRRLPDEGFHLVKLHQSRDFSSADADDDWDELMRVSGEFEDELRALATTLDARWGRRKEMSMEDYAYLDPDDEDDNLAPPLFRELVQQGWFGDLLYWRTGDRVVAASVGHEDKEEPVILFAAVTGSAEGFPE
ncbi:MULTISPECIES: hypothetical protein [unclassified Streptomyces]|uniref:hypothetical protein n=1 Tax=unclassified Streptomyces TaxID=2593676 RepID=UPI00324D1638